MNRIVGETSTGPENMTELRHRSRIDAAALLLSRELREHPWVRAVYTLILLVAVVATFTVAFARFWQSGHLPMAPFFLLLGVGFSLCLALLPGLMAFLTDENARAITLETYSGEHDQYVVALSMLGRGPDRERRSDLVFQQLLEFHAIGKSQSRQSFYVGCLSIVSGLVVLISGTALLIARPNAMDIAVISTVGGSLAEFIGVCCVYFYSKSSLQLRFLFKYLMVTDLVEGITSEELRDVARSQAVTQILSTPDTPDEAKPQRRKNAEGKTK